MTESTIFDKTNAANTEQAESSRCEWNEEGKDQGNNSKRTR